MDFPWLFCVFPMDISHSQLGALEKNISNYTSFHLHRDMFFPPQKKIAPVLSPTNKHSQLPIFRRAKVRSLRQSVLNPNKSTSNLTNLRRWPWWSSCASEGPHENLRGRLKPPQIARLFFFEGFCKLWWLKSKELLLDPMGFWINV